MKHVHVLIVVLTVMLAGCQQGTSESSAPKIAESQRQALEQAKAVSATLQQSDAETRKQIDAAGE